MCMPMGAVMAFKGIEKSIVLLHGSQGCSTYIRRHMAGHFNEPIDIASSSLNEEGTVYGGESNLNKALKNVIKLYDPKIIGVATTCLAETIGEDIKRITSEFAEAEELKDIQIVPVSTPGYGGTQFEGYFAALTAIVKKLAKNSKSNKKINIITNSLNPGDIRNIKSMLEAFNIDYILLPDVSITLDTPYFKEFKRIPEGGTAIKDASMMTGATATIEIGLTVPENISPGKYLLDTYNIPLYRCAIPLGIENTDDFVNLLSTVSGISVPKAIIEERGRLLDGMVDSHKHNAQGRAVIYGEPEQVLAVTKVCCENGIMPVLISTGSQSTLLKQQLSYINTDEKPLIIDDTNFETIQKYARELNSNILIGNSDGKVITEKEGIPLVRMGFPIHDRVGGQRLVYTGYNGTLRLLDDITNTLLEDKYAKYRKLIFDKYYESSGEENMIKTDKGKIDSISNIEKTKTHPCYSSGACENARMHIPVAPACNISCKYCNIKFDCVNESRPGVTSEILTPQQALEKFLVVKSKLDNLKVIGIAGPGDALANFEDTKKSIELIRAIDSEITFCLSTNGLMLPYYADDIIELGVSHVTITINAIDPKVGAKIYKHITYNGKRLEGEAAAEVLRDNQLAGLKYLSSNGIICKVNIVMVKGVNDSHIPEVVKAARDHGAFMTNIMPLIPAKGSAFENMQLTNNKELNEMRKKCEVDLKQMYHCKQCRADAIGVLGKDVEPDFSTKKCGGCKTSKPIEEKISYKFAVASKTGMLVDQHFGHVEEFYILSYKDSSIEFIEKRLVNKYCDGVKECEDEDLKIEKIINTIKDCNAVLVLRIGYRPAKILEEKGIMIVQTCESINDAIMHAVEGLKNSNKMLEPVG